MAAPTQSYEDIIGAASIVKARMRRELGVVDVDDTVDEDQTKYVFEVDKQKAALNGISTDEISRTIGLALGSQAAGAAQIPYERTPVRIALWFPRAERSSTIDLARIYAKGTGGNLVPLSEVGAWRTTIEDKTIYHRQLQRVVYVLGEMAGRPPVETILDLTADQVQGRPAEFRRYAGAAPSFESADHVSQGRRHPVGGAQRDHRRAGGTKARCTSPSTCSAILRSRC